MRTRSPRPALVADPAGSAESFAPAPRPADPDYMLSLERGLSVIRAFGDGRWALGVADVARATGMSRAAARRCLHTLKVLGYAASADGAYMLTPAILNLGFAYLGSNTLARAAEPVLERIAEKLHESSSAAVLDGDDVVYVARVAMRRILSVGLAVGSRLPAVCTSMGRAIVAFGSDAARVRFLSRVELTRHTAHTIVEKPKLREELDRVRTQGYALVDQELEIGLRSLAVPVLGSDGLAVGAINVGVQVGRADCEMLVRDFLPVLREGAAEIARVAAFRR